MMKDHVFQTEISVGDSCFVVRGQMFGQPLHEVFHGRQVVGFTGLILFGPASHLAFHIPADLAVALQPDGPKIDLMEFGHDIDHGLVNLAAFRGCQFGQFIATKNPAIHKIHDIEVHPDDAGVLAQDMGFRDRHIGFPQSGNNPELTVNRVGRGQEFARRFFAQHIAPAGAVGQHKGRVGHTAPDLTDV